LTSANDRSRLARAALALDVTVGERLTGGYASEVFRCVTRRGREAVLKLAATKRAAAFEAAALRLWGPTGAAVPLLGYDPPSGALLLQMLTPGTALAPGDRGAAVAVAAGLLGKLQLEPPPGGFPHLMQQYQAAERRSADDASYELTVLGRPAPPGLGLLPQARAAAEGLSRSAPASVLLHGDFIDKNLLRHGQEYLAIDPMPVAGDPGAEIGLFAAYHPPARDALAVAADLARASRYPVDRARRWTAVWLCHQACESWRADHEELFGLMSDPAVTELLR
jgi:streptomycin 6-kinase